MKKVIISTIFGCLLSVGVDAAPILETPATHAYLVDFDTGTVLLNKRGEELMHPASMSKLMTAYVVFDRLKKGQLKLDDMMTVSENAWRKGGTKSGGSTMFLNPNTTVKVQDLLRGVIVQSGNDACIVLAENIAGSEENFAAEMTEKARELGLTESTFTNATGFTDEHHLMTAKELAILAERIIRDFPEYYAMYSEKNFKYNKIKQDNRNPLLYLMPGQADGLKTGHTTKSGFGLTASATNKDKSRRLILVVNGLKSMKSRGEEAKRLIDWGLREFNNYTFYPQNAVVENIPVWMGKKATVSAVPEQPIELTLARMDNTKKRVTINYTSPIQAPIKKGQRVATLRIQTPDDNYTFPLVAGEDVKRMGYFGKFGAVVKHIFSCETDGNEGK